MKLNEFLQQVTSFIRSREAKIEVEKELTQHLKQAKKAWLAQGYSEDEAEHRTVAQMGSATTLGQSLNKLHKPKVDWLIVVPIGLLLMLSFLPLLAVDLQYKSMLIERNFIYILLTIMTITGLMLFDVRKVKNYGYYFYAAGIGLMLLIMCFPNLIVNGEAMLRVGPLRLHVWYTLPLFCIAWAALFSKKSMKIWQAIVLAGFAFILIANIPNVPVLFIFSVMTFVMLLCGTFSKREKIVTATLILGTVVAFFISIFIMAKKGILAPYQLARINGFLQPEMYMDTSGYLYVKFSSIIDNANWIGGNKIQGLPPEAHTDFVFAHLIQSYGFVLALFIAALLLFVLIRIGIQSFSKPQTFSKLLVMGVLTLFATQVVYAIAMTFGVVPLVSIPLPFISYGLTPMLLNACIIGVCLSVFRRKSYIFI